MNFEHLSVPVDSVDSIFYYQIDCIQKHPEIPILPVHVAVSDHQVCLENDIVDHIRLSDYLDARSFDRKEWILLLLSLGGTLQKSMDHFLDAACFDLSLSTMFYPSINEEAFHPEKIRYRYIPVDRDDAGDPLRDFLHEISLVLASPPGISGTDAGIPQGNPLEGIFSLEELDRIAGWSLEHLEEGLADLRGMQDCRKEPLPPRKKRLSRLFLRKRAKTVSVPMTPKDDPSIPFGSASLFIVFSLELVLIFLAFQILYHQTGFHQRFTPVLLVSGILLCFGFLDLFLLFSKRSPLRSRSNNGDEDEPGEGNGAADSIFKSKEEKTVHLVLSEESRRIAMISSGIPGTMEENAGLKAYILVDDFLIGRDGAKVDFKINSLSIGRIHARILRKENSFFIEDLESKNGTFLDQRRLKKHEEVVLPEKCKIRFAEREFYFVAN